MIMNGSVNLIPKQQLLTFMPAYPTFARAINASKTSILLTLQDSSVRAGGYSKIDVLDAFIALAKVGWAGMKVSSCCLGIRLTEPFMIVKKFGDDDLNKLLDTILAQLKVCELNDAASMY